MSDRPQGDGRQAPDGKWYVPGGLPVPPPPPPPPPPNEATALLRQIAKDIGSVKSILVFWTVVYVVGALIAFVAVASNNGS